jgi:fimbrial chaperone protein
MPTAAWFGMARARRHALVWLLAWLAPAALAASLQITPIRVELPPGAGAAALSLRNRGDQPISAQVRVFRWTQAQGDDVLTPAEDIVASPPILRIEAQSEQLVRIVRPGPDTVPAETTYRLLIDELPQADTSTTSGVRLQLRYSVPVFVGTPAAGGAPRVNFALWRDGQSWMLGATNDDNRHAQISDVSLVADTGAATPVAAGLLGYALRGNHRAWRVPLPNGFAPGPRMRVKATLNGTSVVRPLDLSPPPASPSPSRRDGS